MTSIKELRERVEKAEGPDRNLDAAIIVATTPTESRADDLISLREVRKDDYQCAPGTYWRCSRSGMSLHTAPELTASIDSALALVERCLPKHWFVILEEAMSEAERGGRRRPSDIELRELPLALLSALLDALEREKAE